MGNLEDQQAAVKHLDNKHSIEKYLQTRENKLASQKQQIDRSAMVYTDPKKEFEKQTVN